ncbi:MAG: hypothetical protein MRERV_40c016 [Mycoplasmataceae bacterium RV_VA103A]|nr:MAG: hypothetical protein MRERV_40c016 [Mycoplasmataceae bacterium RV_VA103A]
MNSILSIDPGGKTGIYYKNGEQEQFIEISKCWKETYGEIKELVKEKRADLVIFENTNYIHKRTKDGLNLFRLLGALEVLEVEKVESINVLKVKEMTKKLLNGIYQIANIEYLPGRGKGWMYKGKRVSIHQLEAFIVYYLFKGNC